MKVKLTEIVELVGGEAWNETRFKLNHQMNEEKKQKGGSSGRVAVTDDKGQTFIAPLDCLAIIPE